MNDIALYPVTVGLFAFPSWLLFRGWNNALKNSESWHFGFRWKITIAALLSASVATLVGLLAILSWLHSGGSPHGMDTPLGVWQPLFGVTKWTLAATLLLTAIGKGKARFHALGAGIAAVVAILLVVMLNFD